MAFVANNIVYVPVQVHVPVPVQLSAPETDTIETDTSDLLQVDNKNTQTDGLRKPLILNKGLSAIVGHVNNFPSLQCRLLQWGQYCEKKALEVSRIKADVPPEKGGPMSMASLIIEDDLKARFKVAGEIIKTCNLSKGDSESIDWEQLIGLLETMSDSYVFCAGISKEEFQSVCSGIRYQPKCLLPKSFPFERYISHGCVKWYKLRKNATYDEKKAVAEGDSRCAACNKVYRDVRQRNKGQLPKLTHEAREQRTEAGSHYPISLLSPRGVKRKMYNISLEKKKRRKQIHVLSQKLKQYMEVELSEEQSSELSCFVKNVTTNDLDQAVSNENDVTAQALKEAFLYDQQRNSKFVPIKSQKLSTIWWSFNV